MRMQAPWVQAYLPLGWIDVEVLDPDGGAVTSDPGSVHSRRLDLATGVATHEYLVGGTMIQHRTWADRVTGAIVHEVTAAAPVRLRTRIGSLLRPRSAPHGSGGDLVTEWLLPVDVAPGHESPPEPIRYDEGNGRHGAIVVRSSVASAVDDGELDDRRGVDPRDDHRDGHRTGAAGIPRRRRRCPRARRDAARRHPLVGRCRRAGCPPARGPCGSARGDCTHGACSSCPLPRTPPTSTPTSASVGTRPATPTPGWRRSRSTSGGTC